MLKIFCHLSSLRKKLDYQLNLKILDNSTNKSISLECKDYVKYLGLLIDNNLNWKHHIAYTASKISKTVGIIVR